MKRREFLKFSSAGLAAIAAGGAGGWALFREGPLAFAASLAIELNLVEAEAEMVDGVIVPQWAIESPLLGHAGIPGPVLFATEGEFLRLRVRNRIGRGGAHALAIPGVMDTGPLGADQSVDVEFVAPKAGTYLYFDPLNAPVNRVMGLHGVLVVLPSANGFNTPYSAPTPNVRRLFDDLGRTEHFPGHPWDPDRNAVWVFNAIDPNRCAQAAASAGAINPATFLGGYLPQYFTINGKSGFFAAQHGTHGGEGHDAHREGGRTDLHGNISISGNVGQPCLIRNVNAGLMWHSPHIHGNHVYVLAKNGEVQSNVLMVDTWTMPPLGTEDVLLPYIAPPDIPPNFMQRVAAGTNQELFPLVYPMHDHNEISNTAAGGNYPQGLATHFQFNGPVDIPGDSVVLVRKAELRLRTGVLEVEGTYSGTPGAEMDIHAGSAADPSNRIGSAVVRPDGTWSFRGRGLKALASRRITVHHHVTGAERRGIPCTLR